MNCDKCKNYKEHYIWTEHGFNKISCGHCLIRYNRKVKNRKTQCKDFEIKIETAKQEEIKLTLESKITKIYKTLNVVKQYLEINKF